MYQSIVQERGAVGFAPFNAERIYMRKFYKDKGLPEDIVHWQPTIDQMLDGIDTDQPIYLMVDQKIIKAGNAHRRGGMHVDGYWVEELNAHTGGGHVMNVSGHGPGSKHLPSGPGRWKGGGWAWADANFQEKEGIILASDIRACKALEGEYKGVVGEGGDCSHLDLSHMKEIIMKPNKVYAGNVSMLHESLPITFDCQRTVVRLNVPGWSPSVH